MELVAGIIAALTGLLGAYGIIVNERKKMQIDLETKSKELEQKQEAAIGDKVDSVLSGWERLAGGHEKLSSTALDRFVLAESKINDLEGKVNTLEHQVAELPTYKRLVKSLSETLYVLVPWIKLNIDDKSKLDTMPVLPPDVQEIIRKMGEQNDEQY